jgi:hypothetical protein
MKKLLKDAMTRKTLFKAFARLGGDDRRTNACNIVFKRLSRKIQDRVLYPRSKSSRRKPSTSIDIPPLRGWGSAGRYGNRYVVYLSPILELLPVEVAVTVLVHEFGHIYRGLGKPTSKFDPDPEELKAQDREESEVWRLVEVWGFKKERQVYEQYSKLWDTMEGSASRTPGTFRRGW